MQLKSSPQVHDCIVIGSGAAGGMAAWNLTRKGVNVLVLDAGQKFDRSKYWSHVKPWEWRQRVDRGQAPPAFYVDVKEQPYISNDADPFDLVRVWGRGGKTNVWGRVSLRYSDLNLTEPERDGWEIPWPIRYKDIAPYYDRVEQFIGVNGGPDNEPWLPGSAYHQPPPAPRCGERLLQKAGRSVGIKIVNGRRAVLTRELNGHASVSLLRRLRTWLRCRCVFQRVGLPHRTGAENRPVAGDGQRRRGAHSGGRQGAGQRRPVFRSLHQGRTSRLCQARRARRVLRRFHAYPAQLEIDRLPQRHRQRLRRHRTVPRRADPLSHLRLHA